MSSTQSSHEPLESLESEGSDSAIGESTVNGDCEPDGELLDDDPEEIPLDVASWLEHGELVRTANGYCDAT